MTQNSNLTIGLVGSGGDGVVTMGTILQHLGAKAGYQGQMSKYYDAQIRGGGSAVKFNLNAATPAVPGDTLDLLVCFDWAEYTKFRHALATNEATVIICEAAPPDGTVVSGVIKLVPFKAWAVELTGDARNKNVVCLGLIAELVGFSSAFIAATAASDRKLKIMTAAPAAEERGREVAREMERADLRLPDPVDANPKVVLCGNDAVVEGAIAAGCNACFFYPITPATEISETLGKRFADGSGVYWQAESEIAAIMNGLGASLTGRKTVVATSGPGLSLMLEALSFAVGAEIPIVLVDVQRGGPSTGVPTMSEQSDLNVALYGGHGDCPRVVLAPHDLESAWRLTREAFNISEGYQVPTILLSDQQLGQTYAALDGRFLQRSYPVVNRRKPVPTPDGRYERFAVTDDWVSPMADFGDEYGVYQTSGLAHRPDGSISTAHAAVQAWHDKLENKLHPLSSRDDLVRVYFNEDAPDRIITWGSSAPVVLEAVRRLGWTDRVAVCVPELIAPLPSAALAFAADATRLVVIELNHSGQFGDYLAAQIDLGPDVYAYYRSGAKPFSVDELAEAIAKRLSVRQEVLP